MNVSCYQNWYKILRHGECLNNCSCITILYMTCPVNMDVSPRCNFTVRQMVSVRVSKHQNLSHFCSTVLKGMLEQNVSLFLRPEINEHILTLTCNPCLFKRHLLHKNVRKLVKLRPCCSQTNPSLCSLLKLNLVVAGLKSRDKQIKRWKIMKGDQ